MSKKVVLISDPNYTGKEGIRSGAFMLAPPLSILALGSYLVEHGIAVELIDVAMDFGIGLNDEANHIIRQRVVRHLCGEEDDILWIGMSQTSGTENTLVLAEEVAAALPDLPIILGGYSVSRAYQRLLREHPFITAIVRGDGEYAALEISRALAAGHSIPSARIPNLAWLEGDDIKCTSRQSAALDELPIMNFRLLQSPDCYFTVHLVTSRGCPFTCNYCLEPAMRPYAPYPPEWVGRQLDHLESVWSNGGIFLADPIWGINRQRTLDLCQVLRDRSFKYFVESRVDVLKPDLIPILREAGIERIWLGLESASPATLVRMNKVRSEIVANRYLNSALDLLTACFEHDITPLVPFMLPFPGDTESDYDASLRFARRIARLHDRISIRTGIKTGLVTTCQATEIYEGSALSEKIPTEFPGLFLSQEVAQGTRTVTIPSEGAKPETADLYRDQILSCSRETPVTRERRAHFVRNLESLLQEQPGCKDEDGVFSLSKALLSAQSVECSSGMPKDRSDSDPNRRQPSVLRQSRQNRSLIHIGYAKAGSSFLQKWFDHHTQLNYTALGIAGFNNVYEIVNLALDDKEEMPRCFVTSKEILGLPWQASSHTDPLSFMRTYAQPVDRMEKDQARVCEVLYQLFPQSRVLIVTRGYQSILQSSHSEYIKMGGELALLPYLERFQSLLEQWLNIDSLVDLYATVFGMSNLIILPYELLRDDPGRFLNVLEEELQLAHEGMTPDPVNPSLSPAELNWYATISRRFVTPLGNYLPGRMGAWLRRSYSRQWVKPNRLRGLIRLADRFVDSKTFTQDFPADYLEGFQGKASVLESNPLYDDYRNEYLLK